MKHRMHKRIETKPDGRKIYYYTFEPAETERAETHPDARPASSQCEDAESNPAGNSQGRKTAFHSIRYYAD